MSDDDNSCFICLGSEATPELGDLGRHCDCPVLFSHRSCLTRWQLQNAGKPEELECRFCHAQLGDWRSALTAVPNQYKRSAPIMAVVFQGKTIKVPVCTGPEGVADFKRTVCKLFNLPEGTDFEVTFECKSPVWGDKLHLKGFDCFEAASYCAAVSAAKRATHKAAARAAAGEASSAAGAGSPPPHGSPNGSRPSRSGQPDSTSPRSPARASGSTSTSPTSPSRHAAGQTPASFVRRLLCGAPNAADTEAATSSTPSAPESSGGSGDTLSSDGSAGPDGLPLPGVDGPPAAHVATASPAREGGAKLSKPLTASLSDLFRRMV